MKNYAEARCVLNIPKLVKVVKKVEVKKEVAKGGPPPAAKHCEPIIQEVQTSLESCRSHDIID